MELQFGPTSNDFKGNFFFVLRISDVIVTLSFLILFTGRLIQELLWKYIDVVTLFQYAIILFYVGSNFIFSIIQLFTQVEYAYELFTVNRILLFLYFWLNLFCWHMMVFHIEQLNGVNDGQQYQEIRKRIRKSEAILFGVMVAIHLIPVWVITVLPISLNTKPFVIWLLAHCCILLVLLLLLTFKLHRTLRRNLYYYYIGKKNNLLVLLMFNIMIFLGYIGFWALLLRNNFDTYVHNRDTLTTAEKVFYYFIITMTNFNLFFVVYFNIRNINFKKYLEATYDGLGIGQHFEEASIFIFKSPFHKQNVSRKMYEFEYSEEDLNVNHESLVYSIYTESDDDLNESQKDINDHLFSENYMKMHNKKN